MIPSHVETRASHDEVKAAAQRYAKDHLYKDLKIVLDTDEHLRELLLSAADALAHHKHTELASAFREELK
jgi:hypothetical protein